MNKNTKIVNDLSIINNIKLIHIVNLLNSTKPYHHIRREFIFGEHKIRQLISSVYILIISIITVIYIQYNNQNPKVYYF